MADACSPDNILLDVPVESAIQLFDLAARYIARSSGVSADRIRTELTKREQLGSTGLGQGVAIPHARVDGLGSAAALFVRALYPFTFNAPDRKPVREFIVLVLPKEDDRAHLELLADAARCFSDRVFRQASRDALTPDEIHRLMQRTH
ncbi:PTS fructose transporter subunit IIA [Burkholderia cepacia]|uniref:PTS fructose transporter subunit IIA n=1 Tax=Burkholderia cepacia TaxID=292 RepID=A0A0J5WPV2_BURCE|nr:PTS fructose transporter subunit IIA [Burkholderia cepacia]